MDIAADIRNIDVVGASLDDLAAADDATRDLMSAIAEARGERIRELVDSQGSVIAAAEHLGITRTRVYQLLTTQKNRPSRS